MKQYLSAKEKLFKTPDSMFMKLTQEEKIFLLDNTDCKSYKKNEIIFQENTKPSGLICLVEGKAKIFKEGAGNRDQIIRLSKPGGFIGYRALFAEQNYSASAVAIENCITCTIERNALFYVMKKNMDFTFAILKSLATELGVSNMRTVSLTQKHIRGRLAESLLFLIDHYGFYEDGKTIKALLSREDLASLSNMTTSNAIRTLSAFAQEGVISVEGRRIKIIDLKMLQKISNLG
ncbi:MAG: Crp/Fnr family transcriptional regulator [Bacteroidales bacterium]|jgi:CRP-like cAMP-binding protein|nr:Crp/Fnr family transcriptional regulator [Bacteroidales bacterium]HOL97587.1 Crp/Fnr family transcriptional regulator [Bacteroidales bacterium]HOM36728.1 Crp/Fnr family transcriptional regulator [Bacteroidales bacterium]HPD23278.1 Crp/Fnr family transcriptional regulator [Bacteroidales bacterium]HRS99002.1 Crp/Fnr family transcriptional regulator [Bacteroidales bacterium]